MRFVIQGWDYSTWSGGGVALHWLGHNLAQMGHSVTVTCSQTFAGSKAGVGGVGDLRRAVVIYPEVTLGNPFGAPRVVRWILNVPGIFGVGGNFGPDDLFMLWSMNYIGTLERVDGLLTAFRNYDHFCDHGLNRLGTCWAMRKASSFPPGGPVHPLDSLNIDDYMSKGGDDFLVKVFNSHEIFVCYDPATMLVTLAGLCGCVSLAPGSKRILAGVARDAEDLPRAQATISDVRRDLDNEILESLAQTKTFVDICLTKWPELED